MDNKLNTFCGKNQSNQIHTEPSLAPPAVLLMLVTARCYSYLLVNKCFSSSSLSILLLPFLPLFFHVIISVNLYETKGREMLFKDVSSDFSF